MNQQVKVITKDGNTLVNRYDAEGLRYEIEENEKLSRFIFNKNADVLVEIDSDDNVVSRFTRGYEVVAADIISDSSTNSSLSRCYYSVDEQGSTDFITDKYGNVKNEYWYDAFGNILDGKHEVHNRITYTGQQFDSITQQYYLRARFYNPIIGRFTQEDVYRGDGLNLYAYCGNNPVRYFDPSGYERKRICPESKENPWNVYQKEQKGNKVTTKERANQYNKNHPKEIKSGTHGNSLSNANINYGYALVDRDTNEILKFGETIHPEKRYTKGYLQDNNAVMKILESGSKDDIHMWQHDMNAYYKWKYGNYPPLNSMGW